MTSTRFSVSWDSHQKNICDGLSFLQQHGEFVDMTLAADGHHVQVHKMIMSLVSPYIKDIITSTQCSHPVMFLHNVSYSTLQSVLEYVYTGEVTVPKDEIQEFLTACKSLQIKGLDSSSHSETEQSLADDYIFQENEEQTEEMPKLEQKECFEESITPKISNTRPTDHVSLSSLTNALTEDYGIMEHDYDDQASIEDNNVKTIKTNAPGNPLSQSPLLQYTVSNQGNLQIILNRYIYFLRYRRQTKEMTWSCVNYTKNRCPAALVTKGNKVISRQKVHNHTYHDKRILKCMNAGKIFSVLSEAEDRSQEMKTGKK